MLGSLQWPRRSSRLRLLGTDDPVNDWHQRGLALFDGLAGHAKTP